MVPTFKLRPEYHATNPPKLMGFGVFDEQNKLVGVMTREEVSEAFVKYIMAKWSNVQDGGTIHFKNNDI